MVVFGVNPQSAESHREFRDRYKFPFPLLVDADQQVAALYNSDGGMVNRTVYLIGPDGLIRYARRGMPQPQEVLAAAKIGAEEGSAGLTRGSRMSNENITNSISTSSSLAPASEAASPRIAWWKRATASRSWRWAAAGRPRTCPKPVGRLHRWFWRPGIALRGFFNMRFFRHVTILHGCAVGGGSITYACTMLRPPDKVWDSGSWKGLDDWKSEMPQHYDTASQMLGVTVNKILGPADQLLRKVAESAGVGDTFYRTSVAIFQAPEGVQGGVTMPDPYFGGEGPGAHHLQGLRWLHDGLPPRREKYSRHELPVPRRETRREGISGNESGGCAAA